jgi:multiple sugar transport system ATP-binding protein
VLNAGLIEQVGTPLELYNRPESLFVAGFLGSPRMNFFNGRINEARGDEVSIIIEGMPAPIVVRLDGDARRPASGETVRLGVRPEAVALGGELLVRVALVESLGRETLLYLDGGPLRTIDSESAEGFVTVQLPSQQPAGIGAEIRIGWPPGSQYLFDANGWRLATPQFLQ